MKSIRIAAGVVALVACLGVGWFLFQWTVCRVYVPEGHSLMLRDKGPLILRYNIKYAEPGQFAKPGEVGMIAELKGPGRHFYNPIRWERRVVPDQVVLPGEVAICTSKLGDPLPDGEFIVDGYLGETEHKGILRKVFGPGRYRVHPYAYEFEIVKKVERKVGQQTKTAGWVEIPAGYVGVRTLLSADSAFEKIKGIQADVLPPGLYPVNPREQEIDIVEIGYRETTIAADKQVDAQGNVEVDESGEWLPQPKTGICFPSNDGFDIQMDFTAIWGIMPQQAPEVVQTFGNVSAVEEKVILPQSESISRNNGSKLGAVDLLVGDTRMQFQQNTSQQFQQVLESKGVTLLYGLVRHIYIPTEVRIPIQEGYIADELKLTREQERDTAKTEAKLREAEEQVNLEAAKVEEETKKLVASVEAEGQKEAEQIQAETEKEVAAIERLVAQLDAQKAIVLGEADAMAKKLQEEAGAAKFGLAVEAFGTPDAYTMWQFAEGLPIDVKMQLLYAGDGTLWTDLENLSAIVSPDGTGQPSQPVNSAATSRPQDRGAGQ